MIERFLPHAPPLALAALLLSAPAGLAAQGEPTPDSADSGNPLMEELPLEPGKLADLVTLEANPVVDLLARDDIHRVMMNGRLYDDDTLDEVWPRQRAAGPFYWLEEPAVPEPPAGVGR